MTLRADADIDSEPFLVLVVAAAAAVAGLRIERSSLDRLAAASVPLPDPWPAEALAALVDLLAAGHRALPVVEALDQVGLWVRLLPEWAPNRCRPQRNAYHRFTVDRHLWETAAEAAALVDRVARPDLLLLAAVLHDIGKGYPGDHTDVGVDLVAVIGSRLGLPEGDVAVLVTLVREHLLLADTATRRDLSDPATVELVADRVGTVEVLEVLAALTEADSLATGTAAWGSWKAELVGDLVTRTTVALGALDPASVQLPEFPTAEHLALLEAGSVRIDGSEDRLTVVVPDRTGLFNRVAGVLALHGLEVLDAAAYTHSNGMALETFRVESPSGPVIAWAGVVADLGDALAGRLALPARLAERARTYTASTQGRRVVGRPAVGAPRQRLLCLGHGARGPGPRRHRPAVPNHRRPGRAGSGHPVRQGPDVGLDGRGRLLCRGPHRRGGDRPGLPGRDRTGCALRRGPGIRARGRPIAPGKGGVRSCAGGWPRARERNRAGIVPPMVEPTPGTPATRHELLVWAESLAGIARTGLGFTDNLYEQERFEEILVVAAQLRVASGCGDLDHVELAAEWIRTVERGVAGYQTPKVAIGAVVGNDAGELLLVQRADSGVWLYPTGWADIGYSAAEVAVKEVREETGIDCEVDRLIMVLDGLRLGFSRLPLYSLVFHCRAVGGSLRPHPLETSAVGFFPEDGLPEPLANYEHWGDQAFAALRGEHLDVWFDPPRGPWQPGGGEHGGAEHGGAGEQEMTDD